MWVRSYMKCIFILISPKRARKDYPGEEDMWVGWERNSFSFYDITYIGFTLHVQTFIWIVSI